MRHADPSNRTFNYTMIGGARFLGASAARLLVVKFLSAMNPAADVLALASLEVDISSLEPGNCMIVKWRGKPVFVRARTGAFILPLLLHTQSSPQTCPLPRSFSHPPIPSSSPNRTDEEIEQAEAVSLAELRDPESDADRCQKPETLVLIGVCTHLGCVPINGAGDFNGWFCPCHGSHYDTSGRIRKGPAPLNLEVPPYEFVDDTKILVG